LDRDVKDSCVVLGVQLSVLNNLDFAIDAARDHCVAYGFGNLFSKKEGKKYNTELIKKAIDFINTNWTNILLESCKWFKEKNEKKDNQQEVFLNLVTAIKKAIPSPWNMIPNITIPLCILVVVLSSVDKPVLVGGTLAATDTSYKSRQIRLYDVWRNANFEVLLLLLHLDHVSK